MEEVPILSGSGRKRYVLSSAKKCDTIRLQTKERRCCVDMVYYAYMLRCSDQTLYCGYTTDLERRLQAHNTGKGAKYTRCRRPVSLAYSEQFQTKTEALRCEAALKKLSHQQKERLIENQKAN